MKRGKKSKKKQFVKITRWIYWTPRIASILFLLFLAMFSLDVFGNGYSFWETVLGLFMHNILVFILTILLIIAWKHELVGAIAFILGGLLYVTWLIIDSMISGEWYRLSWSFIIAGPAILVGILFWVNWRMKRKKKGKKKK